MNFSYPSWVGFVLFIFVMLALDLGVYHRKAKTVKIKEALIWSGVWIVLALIFNFLLYLWKGPEAGLAFLTGYLVEKSLSVDNVFVFLVIFRFFKTPPSAQPRVLVFGIIGALVMRAIFIIAGVFLIQKFHFVIYLFGGFLLYVGFRMLGEKEKKVPVERNRVISFVRRFIPVLDEYRGARFLVREGKKWHATPLLLTLVTIEFTDLLFAADSIPAILAITPDPFIVFTSNIFAILGLRALYFALAEMVQLFTYLHYGLSIVLIFIGAKMLLSDIIHIPTAVALGVVLSTLATAVGASLLTNRLKK